MHSPLSPPASRREGFLCQTLRLELDKLSAQWPCHDASPTVRSSPTSTRGPSDEIVWGLERIEGLWRYLARIDTITEGDEYLKSFDMELSQQIKALETQLEAVRREHKRLRALMMRRICLKRAAIFESLNRSRELPPGAIGCPPGNVKDNDSSHQLDLGKLMRLEEFDPAEVPRSVATSAAAAARARSEAERTAIQRKFNAKAEKLSAKLDQVCNGTHREQMEHDVLCDELRAKLEAAKALHDSRVLAAKATNDSRALAPSADGSRGQKKKRLVPSVATQDTQDRAPIIDAPGHQWGNIFVSWLGQTASPSKPRRWMSCMSTKHPLVAPRMARSVEEATSMGFDELGEYGPSELVMGSKQGVSLLQASKFESVEEPF